MMCDLREVAGIEDSGSIASIQDEVARFEESKVYFCQPLKYPRRWRNVPVGRPRFSRSLLRISDLLSMSLCSNPRALSLAEQ